MPRRYPVLSRLLAAAVAISLALPIVAAGSPSMKSFRTSRKEFTFSQKNAPSRLRETKREVGPEGTVRLVAKPTRRSGQAGLKAAAQALGGRIGQTVPKLEWTVIEVPEGKASAIAAKLRSDGVATAVERDVRTRIAAVPNDTDFGDLWALDNTGQTGGTVDADIDAPEAWDITTGSSEVVVAVCDEGVDFSHPDLWSNRWVNAGELAGNGIDDDGNGKVDDVNGWDWVNRDATVYDPGDEDEHGTHVAGTIGAVGNNGLGVVGVNQDVSIMSIKTLGPEGGYLSDAAAGIVYAVDNGATVINHSWIADGTTSALEDALDYAASHDVINVCAAGNEGTSNDEVPYHPASSDAATVIGVAATDHADEMAYWSNWGSEIDVAAPGVGILSTQPNAEYDTWDGTSMATPHVTGLAALIESEYPAAAPEEIIARIKDTVDRSGTDFGARDRVASDGRINAASALAPEFAAAPTLTAPRSGAVITTGESLRTAWTAPGFSAAAATFEAQLGTESTVLSEGFEGEEWPAWESGGDSPWLVTTQSTFVHSGSQGVRSGTIGDDQMSWLATQIDVPADGGTLEFWYTLSSEENRDFAFVLLDDGVGMTQIWSMNRNMPWTKARVPVPAGTHDVYWVYAKDEEDYFPTGLDAFAIDDVRVTGREWDTPVTRPAGSTDAEIVIPAASDSSAVLRVRSVLGGQASSWVERPVTIVDTPIPGPPTGLVATPLDSRVTLEWDDALEPDVIEWAVRRAAVGGPASVIETVTSSAYSDTGLTNAVPYEYGVVAIDADGNRSVPSSITATPRDMTPPAVPSGLAAVAGPGEVRVTWTDDSDPDLKDWEVWRSVSGGLYSRIAFATQPAFVDSSVDNGITYRYRVRSRDYANNTSVDSASVQAVPRAVLARLYGSDRYATALKVSRANFTTADTVVLATGADFPDALSASALAGAYGGPLLLTRPDSLPAGLMAELTRLKAKNIIVVGGTASVSRAVYNTLDRSYAMTRLWGSDRYATASAVAKRVKALGGGQRVFIARGDTFPDALSASPIAYANSFPVLLVRTDQIPAATVSALGTLKPIEGIVLGSTSAVSDKVRNSLGLTTERWGGSDRYATSALVAAKGVAKGWASYAAVGVATGSAFPDALGGGAALGSRDGVLLLTARDSLPRGASSAISANVAAIDRAYVIGGTTAVSSDVERAIRRLLGI